MLSFSASTAIHTRSDSCPSSSTRINSLHILPTIYHFFFHFSFFFFLFHVFSWMRKYLTRLRSYHRLLLRAVLTAQKILRGSIARKFYLVFRESHYANKLQKLAKLFLTAMRKWHKKR